MAIQGLAGAGSPALKSYPRTSHDALPLPGGGFVGSTATDDLVRVLMKARVPVTHEMGRAAVADAYAKYVAEVREAGANSAFSTWLSEAGAAQ